MISLRFARLYGKSRQTIADISRVQSSTLVRKGRTMTRFLLALAAGIALFITFLVVYNQVRPNSEPATEPNAQSSRPETSHAETIVQESLPRTPWSGRTIQVTLTLPKTGTPAEVHLLPTADQLVPGDAYALYERACDALPTTLDENALAEWTKVKPGALPKDQVKAVLDGSQAVFNLVNQAMLCIDCNWPAWTPGSPPPDLKAFRVLARLISISVAYGLADGKPQESVESLAMGLRLAQQVGAGPTLPHALVGIAIGALTCRQILVFMEQSHGLSLYGALASLPTPLIGVEEAIQSELDNLDTDPLVNMFNRRAFLSILEPAHERVRFVAKRFERDLRILQCLEAIRLYAAAHDGRLPQTLSQITGYTLPKDPLNDKPFVYGVTGDGAILESPAPKGEDARVGLRYEVTVRPAR